MLNVTGYVIVVLACVANDPLICDPPARYVFADKQDCVKYQARLNDMDLWKNVVEYRAGPCVSEAKTRAENLK